MCYFMASQHNCGHLHQWFARCFHAKHNDTGACTLQAIQTWHYPESFPCPECRALRRIDTVELVASKGRQAESGTAVKAKQLQQEYSNDRIIRMSSGQDAQSHSVQQYPAKPGSIGGLLQTMAEGALNLPLEDPSAHTPWIPPSRRHASSVGQLGLSSPQQAHMHDTVSTHSSEMFSVEGSSRQSSESSPPYPPQGKPPYQTLSSADMELAQMLEQAET